MPIQIHLEKGACAVGTLSLVYSLSKYRSDLYPDYMLALYLILGIETSRLMIIHINV